MKIQSSSDHSEPKKFKKNKKKKEVIERLDLVKLIFVGREIGG